MRKTKIVCTLGPACSDEATLAAMCRAGMNVARLNFSHGTHQDHLARIQMIKKVREELNIPLDREEAKELGEELGEQLSNGLSNITGVRNTTGE